MFYVLLLITAVMIYIFTNTYYTLTVLILCIVLPAVSLVLTLVSRSNLKIELEVPSGSGKEDAALTYSFINSGKMPVARVTMRICLENQMTGAVKQRRVSATAGGGKTVTARL